MSTSSSISFPNTTSLSNNNENCDIKEIEKLNYQDIIFCSGLEHALKEMKKILQANKDYTMSMSSGDTSHSLDHMLIVCRHAILALEHDTSLPKYIMQIENPSQNQNQNQRFFSFLILLAALLHDIDDRKLFLHAKSSDPYSNARFITNQVLNQLNTTYNEMFYLSVSEAVQLVIDMISYVSASKNGDRIPEVCKHMSTHEWLLIPRYADRVEAIGLVGIKRCFQYTKTCKTPFFKETTVRANNELELFDSIATVERYNEYSGTSETMIDHYYDKILRLSHFPIVNPYLCKLAQERNRVCIEFVLEFGKTGTCDFTWLESL